MRPPPFFGGFVGFRANVGKKRVGRKIVTSTPEPVKERAKTKKDERIKRLITPYLLLERANREPGRCPRESARFFVRSSNFFLSPIFFFFTFPLAL